MKNPIKYLEIDKNVNENEILKKENKEWYEK